MEKFISTDLHMENAFIDKIMGKTQRESGLYSEDTLGNIRICRIRISNEREAREYNCRKGTHITVFTPKLWEMESADIRYASKQISRELRALIKEARSVLVAGLGNDRLTADSIGPLTARKINVTRHIGLMEPSALEESGLCSVSAVTCGVVGETGVRSLEVVRGIVEQIRPDIVIAVDSLSARECERLGTTIQISDGGISPGAGIGNRQYSISKESLGVPVISIGAPTVVSASAIVYDAIKRHNAILDESEYEGMINDQKHLFVSPKECDIIVEKASDVISGAINKALGV